MDWCGVTEVIVTAERTLRGNSAEETATGPMPHTLVAQDDPTWPSQPVGRPSREPLETSTAGLAADHMVEGCILDHESSWGEWRPCELRVP